jgi:hypothetical protein
MFRYTNCMMSFAYDRYLKAEGMHWRDLFDMVCSDRHVSCSASSLLTLCTC